MAALGAGMTGVILFFSLLLPAQAPLHPVSEREVVPEKEESRVEER